MGSEMCIRDRLKHDPLGVYFGTNVAVRDQHRPKLPHGLSVPVIHNRILSLLLASAGANVASVIQAPDGLPDGPTELGLL